MKLALETGIPPSVWADEGDAAIATAIELLDQARENRGGPEHLDDDLDDDLDDEDLDDEPAEHDRDGAAPARAGRRDARGRLLGG